MRNELEKINKTLKNKNKDIIHKLNKKYLIVKLDQVNGRFVFYKSISNSPFNKDYENAISSSTIETFKYLNWKYGLKPIFAYLFSDEVNMFFCSENENQTIKQTKFASIASGIFSSKFNSVIDIRNYHPAITFMATFDCKIYQLEAEELINYLCLRKNFAENEFLFRHSIYIFDHNLMSDINATIDEQNNLFIQQFKKRGIDVEEFCQEHRYGTIIYPTLHNRFIVNNELPNFSKEEIWEFIKMQTK